MENLKTQDYQFIKFQDDFYNLLEEYSYQSIDNEHPKFNAILDLRNKVFDFILTFQVKVK
ncbi:MAG: hypothetical protein ACO3UU_13115 [Minisyncoccia bacterium]